ncbi:MULTISPECIES: polysaccharide deacetylase [unclassified Paenibacillus]|uniref:polysaccharide deacetylase n=1 Tax=unclassified Paenibacillus TaxID=185978 RepID=UPI0004178E9E|nr:MULTISPECIES: polysaccharide deacetylase [unclassified Paenibacillus]
MGKSTLRLMAAAAALLTGLTGFGSEWTSLAPGRALTAEPPAAMAAASVPPASDGAAAQAGQALPPGAASAAAGQAGSGNSGGAAAGWNSIALSGMTEKQLIAALERASGAGQDGGTADAAQAGQGDSGTAPEADKEATAEAGGTAGTSAAASAAGTGKSAAPERPAKPTVYLTFDDGPSIYTPQVLDILKKNGIKATFFMVGRHVEERPDLVRKVKAAGHSIGNHSYDHVYSEIYGSFAGYAEQTVRTEKALLEAGVATDLVRAPGGTYSNFDSGYFEAMKNAGYKMVDWNVDSGDSKRAGVPAKEIVAGATSAPLKHEMTILLHDGTGHAESVKALPAIIAYYKDKGYSFAAVTPSAEVPLFPLAKQLKWQRPAPLPGEAAAFAAESGKLRASQSWLAADDGDKISVPAIAPVGQTQPHSLPANSAGSGKTEKGKAYGTLDADLLLHTPLGDLKLAYGDYSLHGDKLSVPVRRVVEGLGGSVQWDSASGTAAITAGSGASGSLQRELVFQQPAGTLRAPLTDLLELLGQRAVQMSSSAGLVEVWTDVALDSGKAAA